MRVESGENQLSQDGLYRRIQYPRGIMRWDLDVPAERFGEKAFDLEYTSTVCLIEGFAIIGMIKWFFRSLEFIHRADVFVFDRGTVLDIPQGPLTAAKIQTAITGLKPG